MSRIFQTLGADPNNLGFGWVLPPLAGMVIQPIIGVLSDKTWCKLGRRLPYLIVGGGVAVIVMFLLPNSGNFGFTVEQALIFGAIMLLFMDLSSNVAMQPFKMLVGDMVNDDQKAKAYSIQSFLVNIGSVIASTFPYFLTIIGVSNIANNNSVPDSVKYSFYFGALILLLTCVYSLFTIKELPPKEYADFHGINEQKFEKEEKEKVNIFTLLKKAPKVFWTVSLVQFFCWAGFLYLWNYGTGGIAETVWNTKDATSAAFQDAGNWFGVMSAVQAIAAALWALVLVKVPNTKKKLFYTLSLALGGLGFISIYFIHNEYLLILSFTLIGIAWSSMMAYPFTFLTNALDGNHMGAYLGLFNCSICLPQIVAALLGKFFMDVFGSNQSDMLVTAGISLIIGSLAVYLIKETYGERQ